MDDAEAGHLNSATSANAKRWCVGGRGGPWATQPRVWTWVKRPLVQILVVVANIQMRTLKT